MPFFVSGKVNFNLVLVISLRTVSLHHMYKLDASVCEMMCWLIGDEKDATENSSVVSWPGAQLPSHRLIVPQNRFPSSSAHI